jgi:hypothetical protein
MSAQKYLNVNLNVNLMSRSELATKELDESPNKQRVNILIDSNNKQRQ